MTRSGTIPSLIARGFRGPFVAQVIDLDDRGYSVRQIARHLVVPESAVESVLVHVLLTGAAR